ncbi:uncharacterized protein TNCV_444971 [Trichonephila clavipes]|nr:uncharacterized protein TNCV_444971 [Trichonephila clavipes]
MVVLRYRNSTSSGPSWSKKNIMNLPELPSPPYPLSTLAPGSDISGKMLSRWLSIDKDKLSPAFNTLFVGRIVFVSWDLLQNLGQRQRLRTFPDLCLCPRCGNLVVFENYSEPADLLRADLSILRHDDESDPVYMAPVDDATQSNWANNDEEDMYCVPYEGSSIAPPLPSPCMGPDDDGPRRFTKCSTDVHPGAQLAQETATQMFVDYPDHVVRAAALTTVYWDSSVRLYW